MWRHEVGGACAILQRAGAAGPGLQGRGGAGGGGACTKTQSSSKETAPSPSVSICAAPGSISGSPPLPPRALLRRAACCTLRMYGVARDTAAPASSRSRSRSPRARPPSAGRTPPTRAGRSAPPPARTAPRVTRSRPATAHRTHLGCSCTVQLQGGAATAPRRCRRRRPARRCRGARPCSSPPARRGIMARGQDAYRSTAEQFKTSRTCTTSPSPLAKRT
jgi:hypothetical protein